VTVAFRLACLIGLAVLIVLWLLDFNLSRVDQTVERGVDATGMQTRLSTIETRLGALELNPAPVPLDRSPAFDDIRRRLDTMNERLGAVERQLGQFAKRPEPEPFNSAGIEARIRELEAQIDRLTELAAQPPERLKAELEQLESALSALSRQVTILANRPAPEIPEPFNPGPLEERISELSARVNILASQPPPEAPPPFDSGPLEDRIATLADKVTALANRPEPEPAVEFDPTPLAARIDELSARIGELANRPQPDTFDPSALEEDIAALAERVGALAGAPKPEPFDPTGIEDEIAALAQRIDALPKPLPPFDASNLVARLTGLEVEIAELSAKLPVNPAALSNQVAALEAQVADLEARPQPTPASAFDATPLEAQIAALSARIDTLAQKIPSQQPSEPAPGAGVQPSPSLEGLDPDDIARELAARKGAPPTGTIAVIATEEAWVRLRDGRRTVFQGLIPAGSRLDVPEDLAAPNLRAGNAGSVYLAIGGNVYGPVGRPNRVARRLPITPEDIAAAYPEADLDPSAFTPAPDP